MMGMRAGKRGASGPPQPRGPSASDVCVRAPVVEQLVARGPTVLALEDLHWADATSLRLTEEMAGLAHDAPLLVIATRRPEPDPVLLPSKVGSRRAGHASSKGLSWSPSRTAMNTRWRARCSARTPAPALLQRCGRTPMACRFFGGTFLVNGGDRGVGQGRTGVGSQRFQKN